MLREGASAAEPWAGAAATPEALFDLVYDELKRIARYQLRAMPAPAMLCTTELVHEAYLKLAQGAEVSWKHRAHFFGAASRAMRQVLVDFARRRRAAKHGGGWSRVTLGHADAALETELDEILALDGALDRLNAVDQRLRQIVELRFFAGLAEREVAKLLGLSERTVERYWLKARLFLMRELDTPT
jgi:RNA polymerase sigma factor (TIGR02999 family)